MNDKRIRTLTLQDIGRQAGLTVLPPGGAWVCVKGCPMWPRGQRLIKVHREIGIEHLDIYWGYKEVLTMPVKVNRFRKRNLALPDAVVWDIFQGVDPDEALARAVQDLLDFVNRSYIQTSYQASLITISHPYPEEVRFFNGEVSAFNAGLIRSCLQENYLETKIFGESTIPILEDTVRDIVESLQVDGLSKAEAYHMALTAGIEESETEFIPTWFYRPIGPFKDMFKEDDD